MSVRDLLLFLLENPVVPVVVVVAVGKVVSLLVRSSKERVCPHCQKDRVKKTARVCPYCTRDIDPIGD